MCAKSYKNKVGRDRTVPTCQTKTRSQTLLMFENSRKYLKYLKSAGLALVRKHSEIFRNIRFRTCEKPCINPSQTLNPRQQVFTPSTGLHNPPEYPTTLHSRGHVHKFSAIGQIPLDLCQPSTILRKPATVNIPQQSSAILSNRAQSSTTFQSTPQLFTVKGIIGPGHLPSPPIPCRE